MILSQLVDREELAKMSAEDLRKMILRLDDSIKHHVASGEKLLISVEANVIGIKGDKPAGRP